MSGTQIDFWFTMGSTYSFLSVMRLATLEQSTGISFRWRPFHLFIILQEMKHVPFADKPAKSAYMWRDIERRAAMYGLSVTLPVPYPAKLSVMANLVAIVGMREGWGSDYVRAAYRRWFQLGQETGSEPNVSESLRDVGQDRGGAFGRLGTCQSPLSSRLSSAFRAVISAPRRFCGNDRDCHCCLRADFAARELAFRPLALRRRKGRPVATRAAGLCTVHGQGRMFRLSSRRGAIGLIH
jgi:2-hydroxychromene-2-carboxylate isomerase